MHAYYFFVGRGEKEEEHQANRLFGFVLFLFFFDWTEESGRHCSRSSGINSQIIGIYFVYQHFSLMWCDSSVGKASELYFIYI